MTVERNNQSAAGVGATNPGTQTGTADAPRTFSFLNLGGFGVSRNAPSEVLAKAKDALLEAIKTIPIDSQVELNLAVIDNNKLNKLQLSSITIALRPKDQTTKIVSHHTLVLEASGAPLEDATENINGVNFNVPQYTEKVYDRVYADTVSETIATNFPGAKVYSVSAEVVPRSFNWEDKEAVRLLAVNAICAVAQELQHRIGVGELNLARTSRDANLRVQVAYNCQDLVSATGLPVRADLQMTLSAEALERGDSTTVNNQRRSEQMAKIGGFVDTVWMPGQQGPGFYAGQVSKQKYVARLTLTRAESYQLMTPGMQLLVLASCLQLAENGAWWSYFRPRPQGQLAGQVDKRDVGALNIEANIYDEPGAYGGPLGTKTSSFDDQELGRFLAAAFAPQLAVAVDVSTCSDDTWYNEIFAYAAAGEPNAINALVNAATEVTNGAFKEFWGGGDVVVQNEDIVLNGTYQGPDGLKHDVRDIDYPAVMNMVGKTNPIVGAAFTDTYLRTEQPLAKRLAARRNIIGDIVGGVVWTGTSRRVTLMAPFMDAFLKGIAKCGLNFRMVNPGASGEFHSQRGTADYLRSAAFGAGATGAFTQNYGSAAAPGNRTVYSGRQW